MAIAPARNLIRGDARLGVRVISYDSYACKWPLLRHVKTGGNLRNNSAIERTRVVDGNELCSHWKLIRLDAAVLQLNLEGSTEPSTVLCGPEGTWTEQSNGGACYYV